MYGSAGLYELTGTLTWIVSGPDCVAVGCVPVQFGPTYFPLGNRYPNVGAVGMSAILTVEPLTMASLALSVLSFRSHEPVFRVRSPATGRMVMIRAVSLPEE